MSKQSSGRPVPPRKPLPRSFKDLTPSKHFNPRTFFHEMVWKALLTRRTGQHRRPIFPRLNQGQVAITWIGHASFLIQFTDLNVLVDPNFAKCVIYVIAHSEDGAMGLIVNRVYGTMSLQEMLGAFGIETREKRKVELYYGGPVEIRRGFVLHSGDYTGVNTLLLGKDMALSTGLDIMQAVAEGRGPERTRFRT